MAHRTSLRAVALVACALALCGAPAVALACGAVVHGGSAARADRGRGGGPSEPPATVRVDERFTRALGGRCEFIETVAGTVRTRASPQGVRYAPDLWITARVECEQAPDTAVAPRSVRVRGDLDAGALEAALTARGTTRVSTHAGESCVLVPEFAVRGAEVRGRAITASCAADDPDAEPDAPRGAPR
jgi:hypothetical protein